MRSAVAGLLLAACAAVAAAREAPPLVADAALEARVLQIAGEIRCLVCQNETLADSQAELAVDLRQQIRERLRRGESTEQVSDFLVARYGDFVRYRPAFKPVTALLWLGPFVLLLVALGVMATQLRRARRLRAEPLSRDELAEVDALRRAAGTAP